MIVYFYKIADDRKVVDKTTDSTTLVKTCNSVHYKDDVDILNPTLEIAYDATLTTANCLYVPDWNRYYYINNITTGMQRLFFECHVDVLKSYTSEIKDLYCVVQRQEDINKANLYLPDYMFRAKSIKTVSTPYIFPNSPHTFTKNQSIILTTGGRS